VVTDTAPGTNLASIDIHLTTTRTAWGQTVSGTFTVVNRDGSALSFRVSVELSNSNSPSPSSPSQLLAAVLETSPPILQLGQTWSSSFTAQLPDQPAPGSTAGDGAYLRLVLEPVTGAPVVSPWAELALALPPDSADNSQSPTDPSSPTGDNTLPPDNQGDGTLTPTTADGSDWMPSSGLDDSSTAARLATASQAGIAPSEGIASAASALPVGIRALGGAAQARGNRSRTVSESSLSDFSFQLAGSSAARAGLLPDAGSDMRSDKPLAFTLVSPGPGPTLSQKPTFVLEPPASTSAANSTAPADAPLVLVMTMLADPLDREPRTDSDASPAPGTGPTRAPWTDGKVAPGVSLAASQVPSVEEALRALESSRPNEKAEADRQLSDARAPANEPDERVWLEEWDRSGERADVDAALDRAALALAQGAEKREEPDPSAARETADGEDSGVHGGVLLLATLAASGLAGWVAVAHAPRAVERVSSLATRRSPSPGDES
jgi:hypothetical protein